MDIVYFLGILLFGGVGWLLSSSPMSLAGGIAIGASFGMDDIREQGYCKNRLLGCT